MSDMCQRKKYLVQRKAKILMGIRITGISTPIGGVEWEYTEKNERASVFTKIHSRERIVTRTHTEFI